MQNATVGSYLGTGLFISIMRIMQGVLEGRTGDVVIRSAWAAMMTASGPGTQVPTHRKTVGAAARWARDSLTL